MDWHVTYQSQIPPRQDWVTHHWPSSFFTLFVLEYFSISLVAVPKKSLGSYKRYGIYMKMHLVDGITGRAKTPYAIKRRH